MGRVLAPGWVNLNLPVETDVDGARSYEGMKKNAT
jgi:hypothetical protein